MIPIWGSGRDLIHAAQTGDKMGVALNAAFLVWDVASVAAGVLSFGTATAAMMGAKAGVRTALKAGTKVAAGMAKKQMAAVLAKSAALKNGLKAGVRSFAAKIPRLCVTACFPAGTPVAVEGGYKNIEDIQAGELVWSWHEETGDLALKSVLHTMQRESDALVELRLGADVVQAPPSTRSGPMAAGKLTVGDAVLRSDALGRRLSKRYRGKVTRWVWDGDQPLHEWQELEVGPGSGAVQDLTTWLFEDTTFAPMAKLKASGAQSVVCDHLGTPLALYDDQGLVTWEAELDSYGAVRRGRGAAQACPFRYQGQYEDQETGLYYNRFRYYDPEVGVYISQDPIGLAGGGALHGYVAAPSPNSTSSASVRAVIYWAKTWSKWAAPTVSIPSSKTTSAPITSFLIKCGSTIRSSLTTSA